MWSFEGAARGGEMSLEGVAPGEGYMFGGCSSHKVDEKFGRVCCRRGDEVFGGCSSNRGR